MFPFDDVIMEQRYALSVDIQGPVVTDPFWLVTQYLSNIVTCRFIYMKSALTFTIAIRRQAII